MFELIVSEARTFAVKEILPTYAEGDREVVKFDRGKVTVPDCFHRPHKLMIEGEWTSLPEDPAVGGQGIPHTISIAASEYLVGTNFALTSYAMLGHGTGKMIELFGTEKQKAMFLKKLYTGIWGGTMLLPEALFHP